MAQYFFAWGDMLFGKDGVEFRFPLDLWLKWPTTSNDNGLMFIRNNFFHKFFNVSWHSSRHFPQYHTLRYQMLKGVCEGKIEEIEQCLSEGWDINATIDHEGRYNAVSLAAHLDKLEMLHFLDLRGAELSKGAGKFNFTPLMSGMMNWNVRVIDYLTERGVDPFVKDSYGFTALKKSKIKNLRTIQSMLSSYEVRYQQRNYSKEQG